MSNENPYAPNGTSGAGAPPPHIGQPGPYPEYGQQAQFPGSSQYQQPQNFAQAPQYGQYAPYGQYGQPFPPARPANLASWGSRFAARIVDFLAAFIPWAVLVAIGSVVAFQNSHDVQQPDGTTDTQGISGFGIAIIVFAFCFYLFFDFGNRGLRQGKTGQSIGKKLLHITVIDENMGRPAGTAAGAGRFGVEFAFNAVSSCVGFLGILDVLWPLWDAKNQALHDKVVHTLVVNDRSGMPSSP